MQVGYQTFDCKADRVFDKSLVANLSAVPEQQRVPPKLWLGIIAD